MTDSPAPAAPAPRRRRVPPLAVAFALMAAALVATAWTTHSAVSGASQALHDGNVYAVQQAVRADLSELDAPPAAADLETILHAHADQGLAYVGVLDPHGRVLAEAGTPVGAARWRRRGPAIEQVGGRTRVTIPLGRRRWAAGARGARVALEIAPVEAARVRGAAARTLGIGALAALTLLGVAIALVRRELVRRAEDSARERERRLASLGEMSAVLAHEIKNPLASLKGNAQLLAAMLPPGDDAASAKLRGKAGRVVDEAIRLEQLTVDLLAFVRTGELSRAPVAPGPLVRAAAETVRGASGAAIEVDDAGAPASWALDEGRVREVIVNLLDNALAAGAPVAARVAAEGGRLVIEVRDHGPGVPPADRERVFEPFFTAKTRGTGLGLAIARRIIEQHGGTIRVDDAPGGGARFRIELP